MIIPSPDGVKESKKGAGCFFCGDCPFQSFYLRKEGLSPYLKEKAACSLFLLFLVFSDETKYNPPQK